MLIRILEGRQSMINIAFLKQLIEEKGMSQKELALSMGLTESCVSRILSGKRSGSLYVLEGLCRAFPDTDLRLFLTVK